MEYKKEKLRDIITGMYALNGAAFVEEAAHMLAWLAANCQAMKIKQKNKNINKYIISTENITIFGQVANT